MANSYIITPVTELSLETTNSWTVGTIIINNGSSITLDLSQLTYKINEILSDIRIIKAEINWPTDNSSTFTAKLTDVDSINWLRNIGPEHIVFDESALTNNNKFKTIFITIYDLADNKYQLEIPILIESRSILGMNISIEPAFSVYNGEIAATLLNIRPESAISTFPDYKTPVLSILT